ncbi:hypothetical protein [Streptomyces sp. HPF1205]|uniref:hypothetical protein n=1 Tax=Streptomyces sp. HPF1205 TaxID=2873262 RepID=UPI001CEC063D|nr:hypothetical protein [Streptomyces sp. HPF1205]
MLFGRSLAEGVGSTLVADRRYPDALAERLASAGRPRAVPNQGITVADRLGTQFPEHVLIMWTAPSTLLG